MNHEMEYYSTPGCLTDLSQHADVIEALTNNPEFICQIVQGLMVHGGWCKAYGIEEREDRVIYGLPDMAIILGKILDLDSRHLGIARLPEDRILACCRDFATLACAIMRAKGIPARSRCGFSVYLDWKGGIGDHWIVEYWNGERWVMNDPQIDPLQLSLLQKSGYNELSVGEDKIKCSYEINPHDLSGKYDFIIAGKVWQMCRNGIISPNICGIDDHRGLWFVRGQLLRDFAALNKIESAPYLCRIEKGLDWSEWELMNKTDGDLTNEEYELLDSIAVLTLDTGKNLHDIHNYYLFNTSLQVPKSYLAAF